MLMKEDMRQTCFTRQIFFHDLHEDQREEEGERGLIRSLLQLLLLCQSLSPTDLLMSVKKKSFANLLLKGRMACLPSDPCQT